MSLSRVEHRGRIPAVRPVATYRVQLNADFDLVDAAALTSYLANLGISHLYCSPYMQAAPGSEHGYDVADPTRVNDELGGEGAHARLSAALAEHGLGQLLDIVPNHTAIVRENPWWWDVLEHGPASRYARYFDVDWAAEDERGQNVVLLPVLGDHYGRELEAGNIRLERSDGALRVRYHDHLFPTAPGSVDVLLGMTGIDPDAPDAVERAIEAANRHPDMLDAVIDRQHYRLAYWRIASRELGYRRFFNIDTLIGMRTEREEVFRDLHVRVLEWLRSGVLDGVRIDHIDGLYDPLEYLERLHEACPGAWKLVEKILEPGEELPDDWPVAGTTGYEFIHAAGSLFVDPHGERPLTELYREAAGGDDDYASLVRETKHAVLHDLLGSDVNRLTSLLEEITARHRRYRDYTREELREALKETIACFPVYRTYVRPAAERVSPDDARHIEQAIERAKRNRADVDCDLLDFLRDILLLEMDGMLEAEFAMRFQQLTGPAMAKGVEDTAFYRYNRLVALNEVGGAADRFGSDVDEFHAWAARIAASRPRTLLATSTHDTKRSEDVRMRLVLLSEIPQRWAETVRRWIARNERYRRAELPDRNAEYLLYQTLVGAWPIDPARTKAYMLKAAREARLYTTWNRPNAEYEEALADFVDAVMSDREFVADLERFVGPLVPAGRTNSLALTLLKLACPGVPDFYRGTELWDLSLVDPDNRRPVDYELRRRLLDELDHLSLQSIVARADEGLPKLWLIRRGLEARRDHENAFADGAYRPLRAAGSKKKHVVAFERGDEIVALAPRWPLKLAGEWRDTTLDLPAGIWRNVLTGEAVEGGEVGIADVLRRFPVALLARAGG
ncbi:MAG: malto-oligosyltrehalose synthase [Gammaproteobacteria bacterium]